MKPYKEALEYFSKRPWVCPADIVMAFTEPRAINEVLTAGTLRYRITASISRKEFLERLRANRQRPNAVAAEVGAVGSRVDVESARDKAEPGPEFTHFYAAECV